METTDQGTLALLLYPIDGDSVKARTASLQTHGFNVAVETVGRFAFRLKIISPDGSLPKIEAASAEGQARSLTLVFQRDGSSTREKPLCGRIRCRSETEFFPGVVWRKMSWYARGDQHSTLNVLSVDLARGTVQLGVSMGQPMMNMRTPLSEMARRSGALAAVNAGYFALQNGSPLGLLIDRGTVISSPVYERSSFGVYKDSFLLFGNPEFSGRIRAEWGDVAVGALNVQKHDGQVVVYTPEFGETTATDTPGLEIAVAGHRVVGVGSQDLSIPKGGIVLAVHGGTKPILQRLSVGDLVFYEYGVTPPWSLCSLAVGGGPRLVKDGRAQVNFAQERFDLHFARDRAPRTAVGAGPKGELILATVDGRQPPENHGATLGEMAQIMLQLGCKQAMNLDGGGSTTMVVQERIVNRPSDGRERGISTGLLILPKSQSVVARSDDSAQ